MTGWVQQQHGWQTLQANRHSNNKLINKTNRNKETKRSLKIILKTHFVEIVRVSQADVTLVFSSFFKLKPMLTVDVADDNDVTKNQGEHDTQLVLFNKRKKTKRKNNNKILEILKLIHQYKWPLNQCYYYCNTTECIWCNNASCATFAFLDLPGIENKSC